MPLLESVPETGWHHKKRTTKAQDFTAYFSFLSNFSPETKKHLAILQKQKITWLCFVLSVMLKNLLERRLPHNSSPHVSCHGSCFCDSMSKLRLLILPHKTSSRRTSPRCGKCAVTSEFNEPAQGQITLPFCRLLD